MADPSPARRLEGFLARYSPGVARTAKTALRLLRPHFRGACELVYDNYNALAIGFSPTGRASDVIASIAVYPRWVSLFFMRGADLPDPERLLRGGGRRVRHVVLDPVGILAHPALLRLLREAIDGSVKPLDPARRRTLVIKSVSAKQRPRRPAQTRTRRVRRRVPSG
jgi:hypothetical protein